MASVMRRISKECDFKMAIDDPLVKLMAEYYNDPVKFSIDILGCMPDDQQAMVLYSILEHPKLSVRSGRGLGKSYTSAILILWFLHTRNNAQIYLTAPSQSMLTAVWATVSKLHYDSVPMFKERFELLTTSMKHKKYPTHWFCSQQTSRKDKPESMAGKHNINMLYIFCNLDRFPLYKKVSSSSRSITYKRRNSVSLSSNKYRLYVISSSSSRSGSSRYK
jgi:hypothetical protein